MIEQGIEAIAAMARRASGITLHETARADTLLLEQRSDVTYEMLRQPRPPRCMEVYSLRDLVSAAGQLASVHGDVRVTVGPTEIRVECTGLEYRESLDLPPNSVDVISMRLTMTTELRWLRMQRVAYERAIMDGTEPPCVQQRRMSLIARTLMRDWLPNGLRVKIEGIRTRASSDHAVNSTRGRESLGSSVVSQVDDPTTLPDEVVLLRVPVFDELRCMQWQCECWVDYDLAAQGWLFVPSESMPRVLDWAIAEICRDVRSFVDQLEVDDQMRSRITIYGGMLPPVERK
ncbi:MAG: hypothetical protein KF847_19840 [Pirellulales bacterium]|nr:hypothetical protein [Pirellulales bacterium]